MKKLSSNPTYLFSIFSLIIIIQFSFADIFAQTAPLDWFTFYGASATEIGHQDQGKAIQYYNGSLYIAGYVNGSGNFEAGTVNRDYHSSADGYVAKMTADGETIEWITFLGSQWWDSCLDIEVTSGGIYVCGYTGGVWADEATLGEIVKHGHYVHNGNDAFVAKLNFNGTINWVTFLGGDQEDYVTAISVDETSGLIYLSGYSKRSWTLDSYQLAPIIPLSADWQEDAFVVKLETDGDYVWHTFMGDDNGNGMWDRGSGIGYDASGNIYIGGSSTGTWGTPLTGFDHQGGAPDGFIAKLDSDGALQWNLFIGNTENPGFSDECHAIEVDSEGNIYATGFTWGDWGIAWDPVRIEYGSNEGEDIFVTKIDTDGDPQWHTILGAGAGNRGEDIILLDNGDLYIAGVDNAIWGDPAFPKYEFGGIDNFAAKLDNDGNLLWNAIMGGYYPDWAFGVAADGLGNIYTTGYSQCPWVCSGTPLHPHVGFASNGYHTEIFIVKLNTALTSIVPEIISFKVKQGKTVSTLINVFDPCGELGNFSSDIGSLTDNLDGTWTWSLVTTDTPEGIHTVTISADDGGTYATHSIIELEVLPPNQAPVFTIDHNPVFVERGQIATNSGTLVDPDGEILAAGSWPLQFTDNGDGTWTWSMETTGLDLGVHTVTLSANDGEEEALDYFDVIIEDNSERIPTGLEWIVGHQESGGSWNGLIPDECVKNDAPVAITGMTLTKLCDYAFELGFSPFDPGFVYNQHVVDGFNYLFSLASSGLPGLYIHNDTDPFSRDYSTAAVMMALGASRLPGHVIIFPSNPLVDGLTFWQLMNELVAYIVDNQLPDGSWSGNNNVTGNVAYGLINAESFGIAIPPIVKDNLSLWIDFTQDDATYGGVESDPLVDAPKMLYTAHLLVEMAFAGDASDKPRVQNAITYLANHWDHPELDIMWNDLNVELLYTITKAFELFSLSTINVGGVDIDWFEDITNKVYQSSQNYEAGFWNCGWYGSQLLNTCWALLTLEKMGPEFCNSKIAQLQLNPGWNWFSLNLENPYMDIDFILDKLNLSDGDHIKNISESSTYYDGFGWFGDLSSFNVFETYKMKLVSAGEIIYNGCPPPVLERPIPIRTGWNWIGYPPQEIIPISEALSSLNPVSEDYIKSRSASSTFYESFGWFGDLEEMTPFNGFMFRSAKPETLIYPEGPLVPLSKSQGSDISTRLRSQSLSLMDDNFDAASFEYSGQVTAEVSLGGQVVGNEGDVLISMANGQVVGMSKAKIFPPTGKPVFNHLVYGNSDENTYFDFCFFDSDNNSWYRFKETIKFKPDMIKANAYEPFCLEKASIIIDPLQGFLDNSGTLSVYPNPFSDRIYFEFSSETGSRAILDVYDISGKRLARLMDKNITTGQKYAIEYQPGGDVANGVLFYNLIIDGEVKTGKIMHKR